MRRLKLVIGIVPVCVVFYQIHVTSAKIFSEIDKPQDGFLPGSANTTDGNEVLY